jgi:hypothetical protein
MAHRGRGRRGLDAHHQRQIVHGDDDAERNTRNEQPRHHNARHNHIQRRDPLSARTDFIATATGRLGYELLYYNQGLVCGKGGVAWVADQNAFGGTCISAMRPDNSQVSCCGEAAAFEADSFEAVDDYYVAIITNFKGVQC